MSNERNEIRKLAYQLLKTYPSKAKTLLEEAKKIQKKEIEKASLQTGTKK